MSSLDIQQMAEQPGKQGGQDAVAPGQSPSQTNVPGLPPTALQMQMKSLNDQYSQTQQQAQAFNSGYGTQGPSVLDELRPAPAPGGGNPNPAQGRDDRSGDMAKTGLRDMAEQLARSYGLNFGRGSLVDHQGNFLMTPDQLAGLQADDSNDVGQTAANMNYIAQAINDRQLEQQGAKAEAALTLGLGQIQQRGRGSLAALASGFYERIAANYTNPDLLPEQADFSFWIQQGQFDENEAAREQEQAEVGGAGGAGGTGSRPTTTTPTTGRGGFNPQPGPASTDSAPSGKGDVVTTGPHAGERPVYTYDPINKTTTTSWEKA